MVFRVATLFLSLGCIAQALAGNHERPTPAMPQFVLRQTLKQKGTIDALSFTPEGKLLAVAVSGDEKALKLFDTTSGQLKTTLVGTVGKLAFCPDGRSIAIATSGDKVNIWDGETGKLKQVLTEQKGYPLNMECSPDGKWLLASGGGSGLRYDGKARLWDITSGQLRKVIQHKGFLFAGARVISSFNPDSSTFMTSGEEDNEPKLWNTKSGELVKAIRIRKSESAPEYVDAKVYDHLFSPTGGVVATASYDNVIRLWDAHSGEFRVALESCYAYGLTFSPDGKIIAAACSNGKSLLWDVATGRLQQTLAATHARATTVAFNSDSRVLAACHPDEDLCNLWDVQSGKLIRTVPAGDGKQTAFSPDGLLFAAMDKKKHVGVWLTQDGSFVTELTNARFPVSFSPDGKTLVTNDSDRRTVVLWDVSR